MFFIGMAIRFETATVGVTMAFSKGFDVFGKPVADVAGVCPIVHVCYPFIDKVWCGHKLLCLVR